MAARALSVWTTAFWRDAAERTVATAAAGAVTALTADGLGWGPELRLREQAAAVGTLALVTLLKCLVAGAASPATGASLGSTVPRDAAH